MKPIWPFFFTCVCFLAACADVPKPISMDLNTLKPLETIEVISWLPPQEFIVGKQLGTAFDERLTPPYGGVVVLVMLSFIDAGDSDRKEVTNRVGPMLEKALPSGTLSSILSKQMSLWSERKGPISIASSRTVGERLSDRQLAKYAQDHQLSAVAYIEWNHSISSDFYKLRMRARSRIVAPSGDILLRQDIVYLPVGISAESWSDALTMWAVDDAQLYKQSVRKGFDAVLNAFDFLAFSQQVGAFGSVPAEDALNGRMHCFAGDFSVGFPLEAYRGARQIGKTRDLEIFRLSNDAVLAMDSCRQ